ncbi:uncharacterized protein LOC125652018 [Ostrea edulis]|uniref:uncharacterized protein LOC125652018 n=1 Tax=Ostrea edulis TaxID=37623 RepID=UPI0024AE9C5D|nr:uncharacterized protein LOC125652018 [Ostrea edulis]
MEKKPLPEPVNPQEKERALSSIKMMSAVALFLGIGSVTVGILSLAYLGGAKYPVTALTGIWYGMSSIAFGLLGIFAAMSSDETTQKRLLNGHYVTSIIIMSMGYAWATAIQGVVACGGGEEKCGDNAEIQTALHGVLIGIIAVVYIIGVWSMSLHAIRRKVLHPEWNYRRGCCWFNK